MKKLKFHLLILAVALVQGAMYGQIEKAPERAEGEGPWSQLIIRGATMINGTHWPHRRAPWISLWKTTKS